MTDLTMTQRRLLWFALAVFVLIVGGMALTSAYQFLGIVAVPGPNTVGEAGKVYYARRFQLGQSIFDNGAAPPYYASMHGPLLHASVGVIGTIFNLPTSELYVVGRGISLLCTVLALTLIARMLRLFEARLIWFGALLAAFLAAQQIIEHAVSYRPDHWNLLLSVAACYLLLAYPGRRWRLPLLMLIPPVAFFIKAPGIALAVPILLGLGLEGRWKQAIACFFGSMAWWGLGCLAAEMISGGAFTAGMRGGMSMPVSYVYFIALVKSPQHWIPWLMPIALFAEGWPPRGEYQRRWLTVTGFFAVAFIVAACGSMRAGSNTYYFLESYVYGLFLTVAWIGRLVDRRRDILAAAAPAVMALVLLFSLMFLQIFVGTWSATLAGDPPMDVAVRISRLVGGEREAMAAEINENRWRVYSDDPGLNVLLDHPQVIDPLMPAMMVRHGSLTMEELIGPVKRREYDLIVLSGIVWHHMGVVNIPPEFQQAMAENYQRAAVESKYLVLMPIRR